MAISTRLPFRFSSSHTLFASFRQICPRRLQVTRLLANNLQCFEEVQPESLALFIATSWGIIATPSGVVQSYGGLMVVRLSWGAVDARWAMRTRNTGTQSR
jgi:hypothetical protein